MKNLSFKCTFSAKFAIEEERIGGYHTNMTLVIRDFRPEDKSAYICVATNSLGSAEASIQVYGKCAKLN